MKYNEKIKASHDMLPETSIEYIYQIESNYTNLTKAQKKIADYILENKDSVLSDSITLLAKKIGTTPPSITRFCQALRFKGFSEFKFYLEKHILNSVGSDNLISASDSCPVIIQKLKEKEINAIAETMQLLDSEKVANVVKKIASAKHIHFYGHGGPGSSCSFAQSLFLQTGILSQTFSDQANMLVAPTFLDEHDMAIGVSFSGETAFVLDALTVARQQKAFTVAITASPKSSIAKAVHVPLCYSCNIPDDLQYLHISRMCEISIIGVLQSEFLRIMGAQNNIQIIKDVIRQGRKK